MRHTTSAIALLLISWVQSVFAPAVADGVNAAETKTSDADADTSVRAMQEIVVTAQRTTVHLARSAQKDAENIVDVLSYDEMRKLPVVNSGDAVRMIPHILDLAATFGGRFGAIGVFSYYKDARGVDDLEETYTDNQTAGVPDRAQTYWLQ